MDSPESKTTIRSFTWGPWLALYCAISYAVLGVDAAMNHHTVIFENKFSWTPLIFAPIAVIVSLICVFSPRWRRWAWILGVLALIVGIAGTLFHNIPTITERGQLTIWQALLNPTQPVLAPAAFASTGLLLLLISWGERCWRTRNICHPSPEAE